MSSTLAKFVFAVLAVFAAVLTGVKAVSVIELAAIQTIAAACNINSPAGWSALTNATACSTPRAICNADGSTYIELHLGSGICPTGVLPTAIQNLTNLQILDLSFLSSPIQFPDWIGALQSLTTLNIYAAGFVGPISSHLPASLVELTLAENPKLSGTLTFASLPNLKKVNAVGTSFTSIMMNTICGITGLEDLRLKYDGPVSATTQLPTCIGSLDNLTWLVLQTEGSEGFSGNISSMGWEKMKRLQTLEITAPSVFGTLPVSIPDSLQTLTITWANITGALSNVQWKNSQLRQLSLTSDSKLTAGSNLDNTFPSTLTLLVLSRLDGGHFGAGQPLSIIPFATLPQLQTLALVQLSFAGSIPASMTSLTNLQLLTLQSIGINGSVAAIDWNLLPRLTSAVLPGNMFTRFDNAFTNHPLQALDIAMNEELNDTISDIFLNQTSLSQISMNWCPLLRYNLTVLCSKSWAACDANNAIYTLCANLRTCRCNNVPSNAICTAPPIASTSKAVVDTVTSRSIEDPSSMQGTERATESTAVAGGKGSSNLSSIIIGSMSAGVAALAIAIFGLYFLRHRRSPTGTSSGAEEQLKALVGASSMSLSASTADMATYLAQVKTTLLTANSNQSRIVSTVSSGETSYTQASRHVDGTIHRLEGLEFI